MAYRIKRSRPTIGVLSGWMAYQGNIHSYLDYVYRGIQSAAHQFDCNLLIGCGVSAPFNTLARPAWPLLLPECDFVPIGPWNTDGLIVIPPLFSEEANRYFDNLIDNSFPIIYAGDREAGPSVMVDNEGGIHQAIDHLVEHGHRHIAFIAGYETPAGDSAARLRGYISGLKRHGIPYDSDLVAYGYHAVDLSYQATREILARGKPVTAVVASNDDSAVGAMSALHDSGLVVPQDVAVIGFDDRFEARAQIPQLTTVHHPMFELGFRSVELIQNIILGKSPLHTVEHIPTELLVRESCGCLPGASPLPSQRNASPTAQQQPAEPAKGKQTDHQPDAPPAAPTSETVSREIVQAMAETVYREMQRLNRNEVTYLCYRLVDAFKLSLMHGSAGTFRVAMQQILEHVAVLGDDLYAWQSAITVLKERLPVLLCLLPYTLPADQIENLLHLARIAVSEVSRGQYARLLVRQTSTAQEIGTMTSWFFSAQTEEEIYEILGDSLPGIGISKAFVAYYQSESGDPIALSLLRSPSDPPNDRAFVTRQFPPSNLAPGDQPFQLAVLPLVGQDGLFGFAAYTTEDFNQLGTINRQLVAALRGVWLYREAVTARQQAEEARRQAENANQLKSRFLSMVSHELRTPLNLISGLTNIMLEESRPVNADECQVNHKDLERVYVGAQHLESLIRDVMDLARSDVGQLTLTCEPLDLQEVLTPVSAIGEQLTRDKELTWLTEISPVLPRVRGDRARLRQIILNLINNAVKFTIHGSVTLSVQAQNGSLTIAVRDTGLGIPQEEQELIFDEFRQSRRTSSRGFGGLGLGLAICKRLVEMHGGQIGVSSSGEEGAGSSFYFTLPVLDFPQTAPVAAGPASQAQRVLLLIKEQDGSGTLKEYLSLQGFQVDTRCMEPGTDWMNWLQPVHPDKVILDQKLASERGWEILKTLKENPLTREIPVLFYSLESDKDSGALLDLNFLTKPLSTAELAEALLSRGLVEEKENRTCAQSILVADDDPGILELHTRIIKTLASGYRILQARNGQEALDLIRAERPALVLLDLMMPVLDGFSVLEAMQAEDLSRSIPVIVLTGQVLGEEDMARLNSGVASVLGKGMFNSQETLEHITAALSRKRRPGSETQRIVMKAMGFIHQHYFENISRADIAAHVGLSERHLTRCFSQEVGLTPMTYLNRYRVGQAKRLLESGCTSITDIALQVGFSTSGYFTRVFRDEVGMTPREYVQIL